MDRKQKKRRQILLHKLVKRKLNKKDSRQLRHLEIVYNNLEEFAQFEYDDELTAAAWQALVNKHPDLLIPPAKKPRILKQTVVKRSIASKNRNPKYSRTRNTK